MRLHDRPGAPEPGDETLTSLVDLAVRRNPRRAHLLVSRVLGKHVPTDPDVVAGAGIRLGELVARALEASDRSDVLVLGYAETATALGHLVADTLGAPYLHSTRRAVAHVVPHGGFEESHSHAADHLLLPTDPEVLRLLDADGPLVLVDDEISTGSTALHTIEALQQTRPRSHYVLATLVDLRSDDDRDRMAADAARHGTRIDVVALAAGAVDLPADVLARGEQLVSAVESAAAPTPLAPTQGRLTRLTPDPTVWSPAVAEGGRHGVVPADRSVLEEAVEVLAADVAQVCGDARRVHVLGFEELMHAPLRLAQATARRLSPGDGRHTTLTTYSTTTSSPILVVDDPGYPIRSALAFPAHDLPDDDPSEPAGGALRYAYNVAPPRSDPAARFDAVVLVVDRSGDGPALTAPCGLVPQLRGVTDHVVLVVLPERGPWPPLPSPLLGPAFGSYRADEVAWLLTDLSHHTLEAPTQEREEAIQGGRAHYAESLPIEYQPSEEYQLLFAEALDRSAARVAYAVGLVTERVLAERGDRVVLASLARAGTPIGILMRRWAQQRRGLDLPHYTLSIVRGRGIDEVALRYLATEHPGDSVVFVDGWTGKGAITRELATSVAQANARLGTDFSPELAVLADPGECVRLHGTREDYLIPSACLNSTVSGLVSRTVLNAALIGPGDFHGAKFYAELAPADVSADFLDTVTAHFDAVADEVDRAASTPAADATPRWTGWAAVESIAASYGIGDVNLVKPGVGETTRVLLRRVPWKVLVRPDAVDELAHVLLLARQRGVEVVPVPDLAFSCVGLIRPQAAG